LLDNRLGSAGSPVFFKASNTSVPSPGVGEEWRMTSQFLA
jgi:hypothetical protein